MASKYINGFDEKIWNNHSACQNELIYLKNKNDNLLDQIGELRKEKKLLEMQIKKMKQQHESAIKKLKEEITNLNKRSAATRYLEIAETYGELKNYSKTVAFHNCSLRTVKRALEKYPKYR